MKKEITVDILCCLFALLFLYTGLIKLTDNETFRWALLKSPLLHGIAPVLSIVIPICEVLIALGLFFSRTRQVALYAFLSLMGIFTIYIGFMLYFRSDRPCTCGGIIVYMNWHQHFYFNSLFTLLAVLTSWLNKKVQMQGPLSAKNFPYKHAKV